MRTKLSNLKKWLLTLTILPCVSTVEACDYGMMTCYDAATGVEATEHDIVCLDNYVAICNSSGKFEIAEDCPDVCENGECVKRDKR